MGPEVTSRRGRRPKGPCCERLSRRQAPSSGPSRSSVTSWCACCRRGLRAAATHTLTGTRCSSGPQYISGARSWRRTSRRRPSCGHQEKPGMPLGWSVIAQFARRHWLMRHDHRPSGTRTQQMGMKGTNAVSEQQGHVVWDLDRTTPSTQACAWPARSCPGEHHGTARG